MISALRLVEFGEKYFPAELIATNSRLHGILKDVEIEILSELRLGRTNKEIARSLGLDEVRVKTSVRSIGAKLGARTRTEIALRSQEFFSERA